MNKNIIMLVLVVVSLVIGSNAIASDIIKQGIVSKCQDEWSDDYELQKYCIDLQIEAYNKFQVKYVQKYLIPYENLSYDELPEEARIALRALSQFVDDQGRPDWVWIHDTCDEQVAAYYEIKAYAK